MRKKILISLLALYLLALLIYSIWLTPFFVDQRISSKIQPGMSGLQVANALNIFEPMDTKTNSYCAPQNKDNFSKIAIYNVGSVPLLPVPMVFATTTTFCFDTQGKLIAFQTRRYFDGP